MGHINFNTTIRNKTKKANKTHPKSHQQLQIIKVIESWKIKIIPQAVVVNTNNNIHFFLSTFVTGILQQ